MLSGLVKVAGVNLLILDPIKKVPVYDQHLIKPQKDTSLLRVN